MVISLSLLHDPLAPPFPLLHVVGEVTTLLLLLLLLLLLIFLTLMVRLQDALALRVAYRHGLAFFELA